MRSRLIVALSKASLLKEKLDTMLERVKYVMGLHLKMNCLFEEKVVIGMGDERQNTSSCSEGRLGDVQSR